MNAIVMHDGATLRASVHVEVSRRGCKKTAVSRLVTVRAAAPLHAADLHTTGNVTDADVNDQTTINCTGLHPSIQQVALRMACLTNYARNREIFGAWVSLAA
jgi:hypothetical protein